MKQMRAVVVTGPLESDWDDRKVDVSLTNLQRLVKGFIESIPLDNSKAIAFVNEEGKIIGLPATAVWQDTDGNVLDVLRGNVVILGPVDGNGDVTPLTDDALAYVKQFLRPAFAAVEP